MAAIIIQSLASCLSNLKKICKQKQTPQLLQDSLKENDIHMKYSISVENKYSRLIFEGTTKWKAFRSAITETAIKILPKAQKQTKKPWITETIQEKMDERRMAKKHENLKYKQLDKEIKQECKHAKQAWVEKQCEELVALNNIKPDAVYKKIKAITGSKSFASSGCILDEDGSKLMDAKSIAVRWNEYIEALFNRDEKPPIEKIIHGPPIMQSEIKSALQQTKQRKSTGPDGVSVKMLQALRNFGVEKLTEIANDLYNSDDIPEELTKSMFVPIPKKPGMLKCEQYRTISLMSHVIKIFLRVILKRIRRAILPEIAPEQFGFVKDASTRNAMFVFRTIAERMLQVDKPLFLCFIDYSKAFDEEQHEALFKILQQLDIDGKDLRLLRNFYWEQTAGIRIRNEVRQYTKIKRGVRQGCVLSPDLFNLYSEMILRHLKHQPGMSINENNINNARYADDTVLIADSAENLQSLLNTVVARSAEYGLTINTAKTKCMVISKSGNERCNLITESNTIEQVQYFNYLGSYITPDGRCTKEIRRRTNLAKSAFEKMGKIFKDRKISIKTKL